MPALMPYQRRPIAQTSWNPRRFWDHCASTAAAKTKLVTDERSGSTTFGLTVGPSAERRAKSTAMPKFAEERLR